MKNVQIRNFFRNALNLGIGGDRAKHVIWRVDNLSFPASIKYVIIHCGTNNIKFNNATDIANGILCVYYLIQSKLPNAQIIVTGLFPRSRTFSYFRLFLFIQAFNLKSLLCDSKRNKRIKLNINKGIIFSQSLLLLIRVSLI